MKIVILLSILSSTFCQAGLLAEIAPFKNETLKEIYHKCLKNHGNPYDVYKMSLCVDYLCLKSYGDKVARLDCVTEIANTRTIEILKTTPKEEPKHTIGYKNYHNCILSEMQEVKNDIVATEIYKMCKKSAEDYDSFNIKNISNCIIDYAGDTSSKRASFYIKKACFYLNRFNQNQGPDRKVTKDISADTLDIDLLKDFENFVENSITKHPNTHENNAMSEEAEKLVQNLISSEKKPTNKKILAAAFLMGYYISSTKGRVKYCKENYDIDISNYVDTFKKMHLKALEKIRKITGFNEVREKRFWVKLEPLSIKKQQAWFDDSAKKSGVTPKELCTVLPYFEQKHLHNQHMSKKLPELYKYLR